MSWKVENKRNTKRQKANENIESNINHKQKLRVLGKTNKTASQRSKIKGTSTLEKDRDLNNTHTFTLYLVSAVILLMPLLFPLTYSPSFCLSKLVFILSPLLASIFAKYRILG